MQTPTHQPPNHPTGHLMDSIYRKQAAIYDITRKYYLLGRDQLIAELDPPQGGRVLEIACGTGRNLIRIGQRYPQAQLYGMDISSRMLKQAGKNRARAGMRERLHLAQGDACEFDPTEMFGVGEFDRIVFSYCLSMIPDWQRALVHAVPLLAPGGRIHMVDFGQQTGLPRWFKAGLFRWLDKFHVSPRAETADVFAGLAQAEPQLSAETRQIYRDYSVIGTITRA